MLTIKVLGPGCINCERLANLCREVADEQHWEVQIEKLTRQEDFWKHGVMITPALIVNGKLLIQGKVPTKSTLRNWLQRE